MVLTFVISLIITVVVGMAVRALLLFYINNIAVDYYGISYDIYHFISEYQFIIYFIVPIIVLFLLSGWIVKPAFREVATIVKDNILFEESDKVLELPAHLKEVQDAINEVNREIQLWKYAARDAEQRKDDLIVYLAHDIRTPLASVLGYLILLDENAELSDEQRLRFIRIALQKTNRIQALVEELFEITRFNISQIELMKQDVNINIVVQQLLEELDQSFKAKNITVEIKSDAKYVVFADAEKIARALENILINAARYTPVDGKITITYYEEGVMNCVSISNTGIEISKGELSRIFDKFYRGDEARQSTTGGSGLGLAIAKNIIDAHHGIISAESNKDHTSFKVKLPKKSADV